MFTGTHRVCSSLDLMVTDNVINCAPMRFVFETLRLHGGTVAPHGLI